MQHYPSQGPYPPPPPPVAHRVWILDCKSCGLFLTNRAMKAVLLLRPNVSLYSSDASPVNCSAYSPDSDTLGLASSCRPAPSRTCECLTQTLCCHGCGSPVGYMIVIPCTRCTSSISSSSRATNGHRFVFHSSEIVGTERHYVPNEPGVIPFEPVTFFTPTPLVPSQQSNPYPSSHSTPRGSPPFPPQHVHPFTRSTSPTEYPPTPPLEYATPFISNSSRPPDPLYTTMTQPYLVPYAYASTPTHHPFSASPPPPHRFYHSFSESGSITPPLTDTNLDHKEPPFTSRQLKAGDVLCWHHLTRSGEIPGVQDDERARQAGHHHHHLADNALGIVFDR